MGHTLATKLVNSAEKRETINTLGFNLVTRHSSKYSAPNKYLLKEKCLGTCKIVNTQQVHGTIVLKKCTKICHKF